MIYLSPSNHIWPLAPYFATFFFCSTRPWGAEQAPQGAHEQSRRLSLRGGGSRTERWRCLQDARRSPSDGIAATAGPVVGDVVWKGEGTKGTKMIWGIVFVESLPKWIKGNFSRIFRRSSDGLPDHTWGYDMVWLYNHNEDELTMIAMVQPDQPNMQQNTFIRDWEDPTTNILLQEHVSRSNLEIHWLGWSRKIRAWSFGWPRFKTPAHCWMVPVSAEIATGAE